MPRRKQDKPQHCSEEEMAMESTHASGSVHEDINISNNVITSQDILKPSASNDKEQSVKDLPESQALSTDGEDEGELAVIPSEDWMNVKATLASLQQQIQILRVQNFQFMQLITSQNQKNLQSSSTNSIETVSVHTTGAADDNHDAETTSQTQEVLESRDRQEEEAVRSDHEEEKEVEDNTSAKGDNPLERFSPPASTAWPDQDEQGESTSYDCTECPAVLPSSDMLKLHMFSHQRHELDAREVEKQSEMSQPATSSSAGIPVVSSYSSMPPTYQSIINDLSNDSMEEYMEIQKPENTHVELLMKNMDGTITDPNQCLQCKRILSCKSALHMHYRTHTGERPFKCKLCSRAFTTKGNLKTHMGIHRPKPPLRLLHSCPVCNKQFTNALVLNQHMKMHSEDNSKKRPLDISSSISNDEIKRQRLSNLSESFKDEPMEHFNPSDVLKKPLDFCNMPTAPPSGVFSFDFGAGPSIQDHLRYAELFARQWEQLSQYSMFNPMASIKPTMFSTPMSLHNTPGGLGLPFALPTSSNGKLNIPSSTTNSMKPLESTHTDSRQKDIDAEDRGSVTSQAERTTHQDSSRQSVHSPKSERSWGSNETNTNSVGMKLDPPPGTTCDICLKTFACRSALEIHYRSHTKHRPFKCDLCDKAFTTRGNMKQHVLTHKSEDLQWNQASNDRSASSHAPTSPQDVDNSSSMSDDVKKNGNRHQCPTCLKHFSSASAVQIHFRTHTGDRPFKCSVCGKAFTTKGNLKVHMGTHMMYGSPSSRDRQGSQEGAEANVDKPSEQSTPIASPNGRFPMMNNNSLGWNPFNQNSLMKASFLGNQALMANYPGLFLPPGAGLPTAGEEQGKPWLWQVTCHICNKECQSPASLELHLKNHEISEASSTKPVTA